MIRTYRPPYGPLLPPELISQDNPDGSLISEEYDSDGSYTSDTPDPEYHSDNPGDEAYNSPSDDDDTDIPQDHDCKLCFRREITVQFRGCSHAVCSSCVKGLWWGRTVGVTFPRSFPCPFCRAEIREVGVLTREPEVLGFGEEVEAGGVGAFVVWRWEGLRRWMAVRSERVACALGASMVGSK